MGRPAGQDGQRRGRGKCPDPEQHAVLCWICSIAVLQQQPCCPEVASLPFTQASSLRIFPCRTVRDCARQCVDGLIPTWADYRDLALKKVLMVCRRSGWRDKPQRGALHGRSWAQGWQARPPRRSACQLSSFQGPRRRSRSIPTSCASTTPRCCLACTSSLNVCNYCSALGPLSMSVHSEVCVKNNLCYNLCGEVPEQLRLGPHAREVPCSWTVCSRGVTITTKAGGAEPGPEHSSSGRRSCPDQREGRGFWRGKRSGQQPGQAGGQR